MEMFLLNIILSFYIQYLYISPINATSRIVSQLTPLVFSNSSYINNCIVFIGSITHVLSEKIVTI